MGGGIFFLVCSFSAVFASLAQSNEIENTHKALVAFYNSTDGDNWNNNDGWDIDTVPSSMEAFNQWHGLTVSGGKLVKIHLPFNNLSGTLPPELGGLTNLKTIWLRSNPELTGTIPPELGNLTDLRQFRLPYNGLTGSIPPELGNLNKLKVLYLSDNQLVGAIPPELGNLKNLEKLSLSTNQLTGTIPPELGNLTKLKTLYLSDNQLAGAIPPELGNLNNLLILSLASNRLTGEIPSELGKFPSLKQLRLSENQLVGGIPPELGNLTKLKILSLSTNQLTGGIPPRLGELSNLTSLSLFTNQLTGVIPPEIGSLVNLDSLHLSNNQLTGTIPSTLGNIPSLTSLFLSTNQLTGGIPTELGNLSNLVTLSLTANQLTGTIPRSFLRLRLLSSLLLPGSVCAPRDNEFQAWLKDLNLTVRTCRMVSFAGDIDDQSYPRTKTISPLILPEATTEIRPIAYTLTPTLPRGLNFDASTRTISGTPTEVTPPVVFIYRATDAQNSMDSLQFSIEVYSPVSAEKDILPVEFAVHANYPNPFRHSTRLVFDLPQPAQVQIEVLDVTGRRIFTKPPKNFSAGLAHEIELSGMKLPSGPYLYRLTATYTENSSVHVGHFVRIR